MIAFTLIILGLTFGNFILISIEITLLVLTLVLYIIYKNEIYLFVMLFLASSIYGTESRTENYEQIRFSGVYVDGKLLDPVNGEFRILGSSTNGNFIRGTARYRTRGTSGFLYHVIFDTNKPGPAKYLFHVREKMDCKIKKYVGGQIGRLFSAIILGKRKGLGDYIYKRFKYCGAAHLLAISGLHVGIIFAILFIFLRFIQIKRKQVLLISGFLVFLYSLITGFRIPVMRATLMLWFFIIGEIMEKNMDSINILSAAGIIILILMPASINSISFQLSFTAVFSIMLALNCTDLKNKIIKPDWLKNWIILPLIVTLSAQIGTLPLVVYRFGYIPLLGMVANLILIPIVSSIIAGHFLLWSLPFFKDITGGFLWFSGYVMNKLMMIFEELPFSIIQVSEKNPLVFLLYPVIISIFLFIKYRETKKADINQLL